METKYNIVLAFRCGKTGGYITEIHGISEFPVRAKGFPSQGAALDYARRNLRDYLDFLKPVDRRFEK